MNGDCFLLAGTWGSPMTGWLSIGSGALLFPLLCGGLFGYLCGGGGLRTGGWLGFLLCGGLAFERPG